MRFTRKKKVALAAVALVAVTGGGALAYWTSGGSGQGQATTANVRNVVTVKQDALMSGPYPGGPAIPISGYFMSPNDMAVRASSMSATIAPFSSQADGTKPACTQADYLLTPPVLPGPFVINGDTGPGGSGTPTTWSGLGLRLVETGANQDNCQSLAIDITYTLNP